MTRRIATGLQFVVFRTGDEIFGVGIDAIREIVKFVEVAEVPDAPDFLEGMINLRGRIVPIIDLRKRLRLPPAEKTRSTRVLITEISGNTIGLIVDAVEEVLRIRQQDVQPPPDMISAVGIEYITGVAKVEDRLIILLDIRKILSHEEISRMADEARSATEEVNTS